MKERELIEYKYLDDAFSLGKRRVAYEKIANDKTPGTFLVTDCDLETHFQCGNETSCLPLEKRCDGKIDCWDAADEINCTLGKICATARCGHKKRTPLVRELSTRRYNYQRIYIFFSM